ncbi:MAG TPA: hypothetical protein VKK31_17700 [Thermoanaerobaculia bacterium]|nr:hypothetical protein [Thermoanaerobaculia bacterium]
MTKERTALLLVPVILVPISLLSGLGLFPLLAGRRPAEASAAVEELTPDSRFPSFTLGRTSPQAQPVSSFTVLENRIYFTQDDAEGTTRIGVRSLELADATGLPRWISTDFLPGSRPAASSFQATASVLSFFDPGARALVEADPHSKKRELIPVGFAVVGSFGRFRSGDFLVDSGNMADFPVSDYRRLKGMMSPREAVDRIQRCRKGRVFLMGPGFIVKDIAMSSFNGLTAAESSRGEKFLGRYNVRVDPRRKMAAIFSRNLPGVYLISDRGEKVRRLDTRSQGRLITKDHPLEELLGVGTRFLYQSDVIVGSGDVLVADPAGGLLWQFDIGSGATRSFALPFEVQKMEREGRYLYLLGLGGRFERFFYPEWQG